MPDLEDVISEAIQKIDEINDVKLRLLGLLHRFRSRDLMGSLHFDPHLPKVPGSLYVVQDSKGLKYLPLDRTE